MSADSGPGDERLEILAVEDSPTQAELLRHLLEQSGYRVVVASTGAQALALLDEHAPSVIVSDIIMPGMNGYEFCRRIRADERTRDIPVILLTSLSSTEDVLKGLACGADSFITKPYTKQYLLTSIQEALANRQHDAYEHPYVKIQLNIAGKTHYVVANQQQMLTLLLSSYEAAVRRNAELYEAQEELRTVNERLEEKVRERTAALEADISERKAAEAELVKHRDHLEELVAERTRELTAAQGQLVMQEKLATVGRVAGSLAHELRNPLGAIRNASCFLQMTVAPKLEGKPLQHLRTIDACVERANQAVTMILDFTQGRPAEPVPCALHSILQQAIAEASLPDSVEVCLAIPPRLPQVMVDDGQMVVVFRNLLTNAAHAMPEGGKVKIQAHAGQHEVVVDVTDTGTGVKPEHMASLFKPLFTTGEIGIGLGLSICQGFVRANNGTISVVSELGKGTTFTVTLATAEGQVTSTKSQ